MRQCLFRVSDPQLERTQRRLKIGRPGSQRRQPFKNCNGLCMTPQLGQRITEFGDEPVLFWLCRHHSLLYQCVTNVLPITAEEDRLTLSYLQYRRKENCLLHLFRRRSEPGNNFLLETAITS